MLSTSRHSGARAAVCVFVLAAVVHACVSAPPSAPSSSSVASASAEPVASEIASAEPIASASASSAGSSSCAPLKVELPPVEVPDKELDPPTPALVDSEVPTMAPFYRKVAMLMRHTAKDHLRIAVYGDSNLTKDQFTGWLRRDLQRQYGDAGHGYVASTRPWSWYLHQDVKHGSSGYKAYACSTHPAPDKYYGFAGISGDGLQGKAYTYVETAGESSLVGKTANRAEVFYLQQPKGGTFEIVVDGKSLATVDTSGAKAEAAFKKVDFPEGPHRVEVVSHEDRKSVRIFGISLERAEPGVIVDSLGVGGASCPPFSKQDAQVMIDSLRHRNYDLIVYALGSNYSDIDQLPGCMKTLIDRHRAATPNVPIVLFGPPDYMSPSSMMDTSTWMDLNVNKWKTIAQVNDCAFWDYRSAMGGPGAIVRFGSRGMVWTDNIHLTDKGHHFMSSRFHRVLWQGLAKYAEREPHVGL
ncbi:MAG: hypothetical protein U0165_01650 [Polyangiaceae bacterium]